MNSSKTYLGSSESLRGANWGAEPAGVLPAFVKSFHDWLMLGKPLVHEAGRAKCK
jgi:hypothetical protein